MSFDEIALPLRVAYGSAGGPEFSTEIVTIADGYERRNQNWSQARRVYDARTGVRSQDDAAVLLNFFHARAGRARGFRLRDWADYSSAADHIAAPVFTDQILSTGNGVTTVFQLIKNYTSGTATHTRTITKPVAGSVLIGLNGVQQTTGWSVDTTSGRLTFATPPANGQSISAGFLFDVPVRFDTDQLALSPDTSATFKADIPLVEVRV